MSGMPLSAAKQRERRADQKKLDLLLNPPLKPKKRRCKNCDARFPVTNPPNKVFCTDKCRKEFFHFGCAFGPMRLKLEKLVRDLTAKALNTCRMTISHPTARVLKPGESIVLSEDTETAGSGGWRNRFYLCAEIVRVLRTQRTPSTPGCFPVVPESVSEVECVLFTRIR